MRLGPAIGAVVAVVVLIASGLWRARTTDSRPTTAAPTDSGTLAELAAAGSDLSKEYNLRFYLYMPTQLAADDAARVLRSDGFQVEIRRAAIGSNWLCLAQKRLVPSLDAMRAVRFRLESLAQSGGGEYDGWEAEVTR